MNLLQVDPIKALFWSAVLNGVAAVPLMRRHRVAGVESQDHGRVDELAARARLGMGDGRADGRRDGWDVILYRASFVRGGPLQNG